jgi:phosphoribosylaminoimidazole-succinocarboxamide synthase
MTYSVGEKFYEGKAKVLFHVKDQPSLVYQEFKDSLTALNGQKTGSFTNKGTLNRDISSMIFIKLAERGVQSHFVESLGPKAMITKRVTIIPLEVVVRNITAGSLAKRLGWDEGKVLDKPLVEFYYKNDFLGDPLITEDHIAALKVATSEELAELRRMALLINSELQQLFKKARLTLVDFKLEFGRTEDGRILLADEISPDTCRLWDEETKEKLDKDRFRRDLGNIEDAYKTVCQRIAHAIENRE